MLNVDGWTDGRTNGERTNGRKLARLCLPAKAGATKICAEFNVDKNTDWRQKLMQMVGLVLFLIISPAHGISHSWAFHMMLTKCRSLNTTKERFISTISLSSLAMRGQRSYLISQTVLQDQALSVSMNQSAHIAGQSLVLNLRSNQISSGLGAHLMRRNNFLLILKMQSKALWICQEYQNALKYARTKVDNVFGFGLYMAPSNMELRIGTIQGYNNKIILSTHDQKLWWNTIVNLSADATSYSVVM